MTSTTGGGGGIRRVDPTRGYGYITPDDGGKEIYFGFSVVEGGTIPKAGQWVEYQAGVKGTARTATKVALVSRWGDRRSSTDSPGVLNHLHYLY